MFALRDRRAEQQSEQLLKLYWNRAAVKRELRELRRERFALLDKVKEHEGEILRAQEQLDGLERLLTNPLAAANAMVYFQLRHLWRVAAQRLEQFAKELQMQREKRERAQVHEAALAKRQRRLDAIYDKLRGLADRRSTLEHESRQLAAKLDAMNRFVQLIKGPRFRNRLAGMRNGIAMLEQKTTDLKELCEKIQGEPLPDLEELSLESRRLVNTAVIALAQHLILHFVEHDLATLARTATERSVGDMKFGDRRDCDRMVERIRERIDELKKQKTLADDVKRRADFLLGELTFRNDTDSVPAMDSVQLILRDTEAAVGNSDLSRRSSDAPVRINVIADDYWELLSVLR
jgi:hypothetical protein